jgi:hypothetical protein
LFSQESISCILICMIQGKLQKKNGFGGLLSGGKETVVKTKS